jgi:hypothetical protein
MKTLIGMNRGDLEVLEASDVDWLITPDELLYTAGVFEAFWQYNGDAAKEGRKGLHAELKSGLHSDGFFARDPRLLQSQHPFHPESLRSDLLKSPYREHSLAATPPAASTPGP